MRWMFALKLAILLAIIPSAQGQVVAASDELHQLVADKRYPEAMQKITAGLALKGPAAKSVDRCDLFMLKGECHLQMRAVSMAIDAFNNAAKEAKLLSDDRRQSIAEAHAALLKASKAFAYMPKASEHLGRFTQEILRGPGAFSPGIRELIAAYTSYKNHCPF